MLDGLRGVAAIAVMLFHFFPQLPGGLIGHGYLAVDFFFLLSGFVIAYNYDDKIASGLTFRRFALIRAIRLYPLVVAAVLAVAALRLAYPKPVLPTAKFSYDVLMNILLLPGSTDRLAEKFVFVPPSWSLFFEVAVNLTYAAVFPWLGKRTLSAVFLVLATTLAIMTFRQGSVELLHQTFAGGLVRTASSFVCGVILCRYAPRWKPFRFGGAAIVYAALILTLLTPIGYVANALYDLVIIFAIYPLLLWIGVANPSDRVAVVQEELGELSYPIYLLHMPVMAYVGIALGWALGGRLLPAVASLATIVAAALAWRFYDRPVRSWLSARWLRRAPSPILV